MKSFNGLSLPQTLDEWVDPARTALLVYDMQIGIVRQVKGAEAVVDRIATLVAAARKAGMRIAFCRHNSLPKPWTGAAAMRMAMAWQRKDDPADVTCWFPREAEATGIVPALAPEDEDMVFDKIAMSAFEGTWLATALRDAGISGLAIAGIAMEIGIEPTCRHAADLGFVPILIEDACGAGDVEAATRSVEALRFAGDTIITTQADFLAALG